jgi:hypothetical protein
MCFQCYGALTRISTNKTLENYVIDFVNYLDTHASLQ